MLSNKRKTYISLILILVLGFLGFNFVFPKYVNTAADGFNNFQFSILDFQLKLPRFPEIKFKLGLDLQGGSRLTYQADLSKLEEKGKGEAMQGLRDVIERRVNLFGVGEPVVVVQGARENQRLIVELPGVHDVNKAIEMIGKTPYLEFKEEREEAERNEILEKQKKLQEEIEKQAVSTTTIEERIKEDPKLLEDPYFKPTKLTGQFLKKSTLTFDQTSFKPEVLLEFNDEGKEIFEELTEKNVGKRLAIYVDNVLISAPRVQEAITGGNARITGDFSAEEAKDLVRNLNVGALPVPVQLISQTTIGPTLGAASLQKSLKAGIVGFLGICLFMLLLYRLPGFFASLSLLIYVFVLLALFKILGVTLTLAGIAGFILSMGMAVDANILIFARLREELKENRAYLAALKEGLRRAWPSIRDGNFTTILVALILFAFGTSFVKGFALTMLIGNLIGMLAAIFITNTLLRCFPEPKIKKLSWLWR